MVVVQYARVLSVDDVEARLMAFMVRNLGDLGMKFFAQEKSTA
jgi:hypothetical protein